MALKRKTIENPFSGERITFERHGNPTDGEYFTARVNLAPRGAGPPEHIHPMIEERFTVLSGTLTACVGGKTDRYGPGAEIVVPPGTPHRWWNERDEEVVVDAVVKPASRIDEFLANVFAMAQLGYADEKGMPHMLRMSRILPQYWDVLHLSSPPLPIQKATMAVLGVVARILGYPDHYPYPYEDSRTP